ncbi:hypothetical protein KUH03_17510 [Sphingobacterium sp. E70]|uniref:hypothetical protein n=1 Tax=Sphingobacterium sp. E70 TaxID=2853439 RepID=UPI00211C706C|nr:hypothetical protein [Sphingobacterium sp. E70]ULT28227.1 hypothetical protein KUH03_17510 [Sphingobacterium sp. E70]
MKRTVVLFALAAIMASCNQKPKETTAPPAQQDTSTTEKPAKIDTTATLDLASIPYSDADIGVFPFFTPPKGYKEMNQPINKDFDVCFFAINGIMKPYEGRLYKANITNEQGTQYSQRYFEKAWRIILLRSEPLKFLTEPSQAKSMNVTINKIPIRAMREISDMPMNRSVYT